MKVVEYKCSKIITDADFDKVQQDTDRGKQICKQYKDSVYQTWKIRHDFLLPGDASDGTRAMKIDVSVENINLADNDANVFAELVIAAMQDIFKKDNVLSCSFINTESIKCVITVLPLMGRIPGVTKYVSKIHPDQLTDALKTQIERQLCSKFNNLAVTGMITAANPEELGYQPALINFKPAPYRKEDDTVITYNTQDTSLQVQTIMPVDELQAIIASTINAFTIGTEATTFELAQQGKISQHDFFRKVMNYIDRYHPGIKDNDKEVILSQINRWAYGFYILDPLIDADEISDIMVLAPDDIRVKVGSARYNSNFKFNSVTDYSTFITGIAVRNNLDIRGKAIHVFSDTQTNDKFRLRLNIVLPYITSTEYPYFHIRKICKNKRGFDYLLKAGMLDTNIMNYLVDRARNGKGMIFTGKGASGKTTLMNTLLDCIPFDKSGLVIQESEELFSDVHPHLMFEHITENSANSNLRYGLQDLARNGLLTDLDYFIIGEVKGAEAKYFINAADTGHKCWCSVHAPSALDAIDKLADYVTYESKYSKDEAAYMLKDLGTVIFMKDFKVCEIAEISGWDNEKKCLTYTPIYLRPGMDHSAFEMH